jgi:adenylate kinase
LLSPYYDKLPNLNVSCACQEILEGVTDIDLVINLKLREEALLAKCLGRRMCSQCGGNFNVADIDIEGENGGPRMYMPPLLPPPQCESKLITRADDTEKVVKERLRVYHDLVRSSGLRLFFFPFFSTYVI